MNKKFWSIFLKLFFGITLVLGVVFSGIFLIMNYFGDIGGFGIIFLFVIAGISAVIAFFESKYA